jgi:hypothetical protein
MTDEPRQLCQDEIRACIAEVFDGRWKHWRCFHCDDVFADRAEAQAHFGLDVTETPACIRLLTTDEKQWAKDLMEWAARAHKAEAEAEQKGYEAYAMKGQLRDRFKVDNVHQAWLLYETMEGDLQVERLRGNIMRAALRRCKAMFRSYWEHHSSKAKDDPERAEKAKRNADMVAMCGFAIAGDFELEMNAQLAAEEAARGDGG